MDNIREWIGGGVSLVFVAYLIWRLEASFVRAQTRELDRNRAELDAMRAELHEVRGETEECRRERLRDQATIVALRGELAVAQTELQYLRKVPDRLDAATSEIADLRATVNEHHGTTP